MNAEIVNLVMKFAAARPQMTFFNTTRHKFCFPYSQEAFSDCKASSLLLLLVKNSEN